MIQYGLNGATTMPLDQASEIRLAAATGFDLIEFRAPKIDTYLQTGTVAELKQALDSSGLRALSINALEQVDTRPAGGARALAAECEKLASWAQALSCPYIIAVPGFLEKPMGKEESVARAVDCLAPLVETAARHEVRLGFEFLGFANCTVNSLALAREIVVRLKSPAAGLVIDTFHFYLANEPVELLSEIAPGELFLFHVNDAESQPRARLRDEHRLLPGLGVIPLREIWDVLRERKLINHASLELFRPEYWARPTDEFLREALGSLRQVFA